MDPVLQLHDWSNNAIRDGLRDGRLQVGLIVPPVKASSMCDLRYEELFHQRVCVAVAPQHRFARRHAIPLTEVAAEPLIGLTREDYPEYYDYLSVIFSKVKQKPRVIEEHDSVVAVMSAVEAGTGVTIGGRWLAEIWLGPFRRKPPRAALPAKLRCVVAFSEQSGKGIYPETPTRLNWPVT